MAASVARSSTGTRISRIFTTNYCCMYRCSVNFVRAWVVMRESLSGLRSAWLHTVSDNGFPAAPVAVGGGEGLEILEGGVREDGFSGGLEEKQLRLHRRRRGSSGVAALQENPNLLTIPGMGPRNLRKLVEKGIAGVAELKDKFLGTLVRRWFEFSQSSVGINHRNRAESITNFIKESVHEDLKDDCPSTDVQPTPKKRLTFCVEGNISVGKTTSCGV